MDKQQAAQAMGMKLREIVDVTEVPGGHAVKTHDGIVTLVTRDGEFLPYGPVPAVAIVDEVTAPEPEPLEDVVAGTEKAVLAWVGEDVERARLALEAELSHESPRKGLVDKLGKLAG